jgi:hypothetical protein
MNTGPLASMRALTAAAGLAVSGSAFGSIETVIRSVDSIPGLSGGEVWLGNAQTFSNAGIDVNGNVAIRGTLLGTNASPGPGGVTNANAVGLWYGAPGSLSLFARDGAAGPALANPNNWTHNSVGGTGAGLSVFLVMSGNGTILASSALNGPGATSTNNTAFWTGPYNGMQMGAQRGFAPATAPGTGSAVFASNMSNFQKVNNSGQVVFNSALSAGDTISGTWSPTTLTNDSGIWVGGPSGISLVLREGDSAPSTGGAIFGDITNIATHSINANGSVMVKAPLRSGTGAPGGVTTTNNNAAWCNAGGSLAQVARASDPVPGLAGVSYGTAASFYSGSNQDFNNNGRLIYDATLGAGSTTADNEALMTWTPGAGASVLFRKGGAAPGALGAGGATFVTFNGTNMQGRLNNNDVVAFSATVQGSGITTSNDETIWTTGIGGTPVMIAREGDAVPGLSGVNFGGALINASALVLNNLDEVAFVNTLSDGTMGLFTWDPTLGLSMVIRTTQTGVVPGMGAIATISFSNGGNGNGGSSYFSDTGWLTFNVSDTSGNFAVVRTMVIPEPGPMVLLGLAGLVAGRRRR